MYPDGMGMAKFAKLTSFFHMFQNLITSASTARNWLMIEIHLIINFIPTSNAFLIVSQGTSNWQHSGW